MPGWQHFVPIVIVTVLGNACASAESKRFSPLAGLPAPAAARTPDAAKPRCFWDDSSSDQDAGAAAISAAVDQLNTIADMPYICDDLCRGGSGCGDALFWRIVRYGVAALPYLVAKLDDPRPCSATVPNTGGVYAVGDVALEALETIVQDVPVYEIVGVKAREDEGEAPWWRFVRRSIANRRRVRQRIAEWLGRHEARLVWVHSVAPIANPDCVRNCAHPAGGYFVVK